MPKKIDLKGHRYGRLIVLEEVQGYVSPKGSAKLRWLCRCDCGTTIETTGNNLRRGNSRSCGCTRTEKNRARAKAHGLVNSLTYKTWSSMIQRCTNPNNKNYPQYGGRGISVCASWRDFDNFLREMGEKPEGMTIDRIDVNGNYCKENCRWVSFSMQGFNQRKRSTNTSGRTGVCPSETDGKWMAFICYQSKQIALGTFESFEAAVAAREAAELKYFGFIKE